MRIAIFGLGYVGTVSTACFAEAGHEVVGVDVNPLKVDLLNSGTSPVVEEGVAEMIREAVALGAVHATSDGPAAVAMTEASLVCVGTPSRENGSLDTEAIHRTMESIGSGLRMRAGYHVVILRSTSLPGTIEGVREILELRSGKKAGEDFGLCVNPEFLREGSAVEDFNHPPFTIIGESDRAAGDVAAELYQEIEAPLYRIPLGAAEMVKYASNAFHALKAAFANEIGEICAAQGTDGRVVMDLLTRDTKLNISRAYLRPGFAFGGSCLPKDLRAITYRANRLDLRTPLLSSILPANEAHLDRGIQQVLKHEGKRIGLLGLAFKGGTDDLRESPMMCLAETLIGKGRQLRIFDENVRLSRLIGANKAYLEEKIPHISSLLVDTLEDAVEFGEVLVVGSAAPPLARLPDLIGIDRQRLVIDLAGAFPPDAFVAVHAAVTT
ncbi:MAG: GDP-mannose dehydrogenase [Gemmatimonadetes bacterium]|nr:GDP-mannose dehydrogenase [Gemmatimonadota bacterium]